VAAAAPAEAAGGFPEEGCRRFPRTCVRDRPDRSKAAIRSDFGQWWSRFDATIVDMGSRIEYVLEACPLGRVLVAATERGVCFVDLGDDDADLTRRLLTEFPFAECERSRSMDTEQWSRGIVDYLYGKVETIDVPLDVSGSRFQRRVWAALRKIPRGETRSYSDVAREIGVPRGARAVAQACAANPVPVVTPCHRVIEKSGRLGGYARGVWRKRQLLRLERGS
jgi:AraC family transcriptional regulator of adaptative response/methylated-DNA-[protein]-cysteine methyltransferase